MNYDEWKLQTPPENNLTFENKTPKIMKTAKERFKEIKNLIDNNMIPEGCEMRIWINNCTKKELLDLGAELGIACEKRLDNIKLYLFIELGDNEITLWE